MTAAAWVAVALAPDKWGVAVVQEGVAGYAIDASRPAGTWTSARRAALTANETAGVSAEEAWRVVESSMAASRVAGMRWGPRGT